MFTITCKDMGMDCTFEAQASTMEDLMLQMSDHAASSHGLTPDQMTPEMEEKLKAAVKQS
ncbi:MAG: DUF1059 domain-containing protein [Patescibacteria group bacterium]